VFNDDTRGPILVFFANFLFSKRKWKVFFAKPSFYQKKAEGIDKSLCLTDD